MALALAATMPLASVVSPLKVNAVEEPVSLERQLIPLPVDSETTQDKLQSVKIQKSMLKV